MENHKLKAVTGILKTPDDEYGGIFSRFEGSKVLFNYMGSLEVGFEGICPTCYTNHFKKTIRTRGSFAICVNGHKTNTYHLLMNPAKTR